MDNSKPAAPSRQEIARKLSTTGPVNSPPSSNTVLSSSSDSAAHPTLQERRASTDAAQSARKPSMSSTVSSSDEDWQQSSPLRPPVPLYAISEASDAASGTDSETSSVGGNDQRDSSQDRRQPAGAVSKALDKLKLTREPTVGMGDSIPIKSGYLRKKGERRKAWKKRWFVLRRGQLAMYKNEKEYLLLRLIPLQDIHTCAPIEVKKHSYTFGIVTPKRTYYIEARSNQEVKEWCTAVESAKADLKAASTIASTESPSASGDITPRGVPSPPPMTAAQPHALSSAPVAIPIPAAGGSSAVPRPSVVTTAVEPSSVTTASPSPQPSSMTNSSIMSSSVTSASSVPTLNTTTRVPPNSYAQGSALGSSSSNGQSVPPPAPLELQTVDAGLERIAEQRQHEEAQKSSNPSAPITGTMGMSQAGYFGQKPRQQQQQQAYPQTPGSPGLVSSSEDEDDEADGAADRPATGGHDDRMLLGGQQVQFATAATATNKANSTGPTSNNSRDRRDSVAPSEDKTIMSGYLMKQGKRKTWRKRWFILTSSRLMYSRSHMDTKIHRQIPISMILDAIEYEPSPAKSPGLPSSAGLTPGGGGSMATGSASATSPDAVGGASGGTSSSSKFSNAFKVITPKRTYLVCAPSEEDEIKWLAALQCLVARKASSATTPNQQPQSQSQSQGRVGSAGPAPAASSMSPQGLYADHGRTRSGTMAARQAVQDAQKRYAVSRA